MKLEWNFRQVDLTSGGAKENQAHDKLNDFAQNGFRP
jgi:hypothetical protein